MSDKLDRLESLIEKCSKEVENCNLHMVELRTEVRYLKEEVDEVSKVVKDGNGTPPLTSRVAVLENKVGRINQQDKVETQKTWTLVAALIAAGGSIVASIVTLFGS